MKKTLFLLILFLGMFLVFPRETFATACCSSGEYVELASGKDCCKPGLSCFGNASNFDHNLYQCGVNSCDIVKQECTNTPQTTAATCPSGYREIQPEFIRSKCELTSLSCCKFSLGNPDICIYKDTGSRVNEGGFRGCSLIEFTNKRCSDSTMKINADGKCEKYVESPWDLKKTTCKDVSTQEDIVGFATAIGCVPTGNLQAFLKFVLVYAFFASGGIILLLIISTGYTLITSSGNPEKLQGAQENIVALFSGLALIAFSLVLLQAIGADILNLKAFIP